MVVANAYNRTARLYAPLTKRGGGRYLLLAAGLAVEGAKRAQVAA